MGQSPASNQVANHWEKVSIRFFFLPWRCKVLCVCRWTSERWRRCCHTATCGSTRKARKWRFLGCHTSCRRWWRCPSDTAGPLWRPHPTPTSESWTPPFHTAERERERGEAWDVSRDTTPAVGWWENIKTKIVLYQNNQLVPVVYFLYFFYFFSSRKENLKVCKVAVWRVYPAPSLLMGNKSLPRQID